MNKSIAAKKPFMITDDGIVSIYNGMETEFTKVEPIFCNFDLTITRIMTPIMSHPRQTWVVQVAYIAQYKHENIAMIGHLTGNRLNWHEGEKRLKTALYKEIIAHWQLILPKKHAV